MKRVILCLALTVAVFSMAVWSYLSICGISDEIIPDISSVSSYAQSNNYSASLIFAEKANARWKEFLSGHIFVTDKEHIMEITTALTRIESLARQENEEVVTECDVVKRLIEVYLEKQEPDILNIL